MYKFFGEPNMSVNFMLNSYSGKPKITHFFRFDENGEALIDEEKCDLLALRKASLAFKFEKVLTREEELENMELEDLKVLAQQIRVTGFGKIRKENLIIKILEKEAGVDVSE